MLGRLRKAARVCRLTCSHRPVWEILDLLHLGVSGRNPENREQGCTKRMLSRRYGLRATRPVDAEPTPQSSSARLPTSGSAQLVAS